MELPGAACRGFFRILRELEWSRSARAPLMRFDVRCMPTAWGGAVGDDAEYMMELEAEEAAHERLVLQSQMDAPRRPLLTWVDGELDDVWDWEPATRVLDVFGQLHRESGLGSAVFSSIEVPTVDEAERAPIDDFRVEASGANYEVIILSHDDEVILDAKSSELQAPENRLLDRMLGEMLDTMLAFIRSRPEQHVFLFARVL